MSIISTIGRKSLKVQCLIWSIYIVLTLGALTMIYPFWLMISGTGKSMTDVSEMKLIPAYLVDDTAYYRKTIASLFNENLIAAQSLYNEPVQDFKTFQPPAPAKFRSEWESFINVKNFPSCYYLKGPAGSKPAAPKSKKAAKPYDGARLSPRYPEKADAGERGAWESFVRKSADPFWVKVDVDASQLDAYQAYIKAKYGNRLDALNKAYKTKYKNFSEIPIPREIPALKRDARALDYIAYIKGWADPVTGKSYKARKESLYLTGTDALFQNYLKSKYKTVDEMNEKLGTYYDSFERVNPPQKEHLSRGSKALCDKWEEFLSKNNFPFYYYLLGHSVCQVSNNSRPENFRTYKDKLFDKFKGDLAEMNKAVGTDFTNWNAVIVQESPYEARRTMPNPTVKYNEGWYMHKSGEAEKHHRTYVNMSGYFKGSFLYPQYTKKIEKYNKDNKTAHMSYDEVRLSRRYPATASAKERDDWEFFVRELVNIFWVKVDDTPAQNAAYREYIRAKYGNKISMLNEVYYGKSEKGKKLYKSSFDEIKLPAEIPDPYHGALISDYGEYLKGWVHPVSKKLFKAPKENLYLASIEFLFRDYLKAEYKTVEAMNKTLGTRYSSFEQVDPPQKEYQYRKIMANKKHQRWEFMTRNFKTVFAYIALQGRGILNTTIYCILAILCALTFNPLAAYALSRFQLPSTYKILLFLMLTMAFPQMVTQIPNFLMMRELGLLNTFGALVLPGLANGYSIFLLKGFFDSLPKELYESAMLDGASETRIFLQITMSLSKPILAVIALNAFTHAYGNFMMALLICQDQKMWTLMPWLYQLQQSSCQAIIYASLIIASIPTFLIFMLCQNVIMRGIVVPVEK